MTDVRIERELRDLLTERAGAGPSPALVARLQAIPREPRRGWSGPSLLPRLGRGIFGLASAAAVVTALLILLAQGVVTFPSPDGAGASVAPGLVPTVPYVHAPTGFFTPDAVADAERTLAAVAAETGVEATLIVQTESAGSQLSTPEGWPERFDRDRNDERDILALVGIAPDGSIVCCLTAIGAQAAQAAAEGYWMPRSQPTNLEADLVGTTAVARDEALRRFVQGVVDLAPNVSTAGGLSGATVASSIRLVLIVVPLLALAVVAFRRRPGVMAQSSAAAAPMAGVAWSTQPVPELMEIGGDPALVAWRPDTMEAGGDDRPWLWAAVVALVTYLIVVLVPLLLAPDSGPRLDPAIDGQGRTAIDLPWVPIAGIGFTVVALVAYASRGGRRRRVGIGVGILMVGVVGISTVADARPDIGEIDRPWAAWPDTAIVEHAAGGFLDTLSLPLEPGDPFAVALVIHNASPLPMTILGLAEQGRDLSVSPVASFVSLGWLDQSTVDGSVRSLSARPQDASATWPVTIGPGGRLAVVAMGRGDECAEPGGSGSTLPLVRVPIAYRVLGVDRIAEVGLPATVFVTAAAVCTVQVPGGSITYGP